MPRKKDGRRAITCVFTDEQYEQIQVLAAKKHTSMNNIVRDYVEVGLNGSLTESNMEFIVPIIREQLEDIMKIHVNRLAALSAKTCVQAGTAAYLNAETLSRFLPENQQMDFEEAYDGARKKALRYLKGAELEN